MIVGYYPDNKCSEYGCRRPITEDSRKLCKAARKQGYKHFMGKPEPEFCMIHVKKYGAQDKAWKEAGELEEENFDPRRTKPDGYISRTAVAQYLGLKGAEPVRELIRAGLLESNDEADSHKAFVKKVSLHYFVINLLTGNVDINNQLALTAQTKRLLQDNKNLTEILKHLNNGAFQ